VTACAGRGPRRRVPNWARGLRDRVVASRSRTLTARVGAIPPEMSRVILALRELRDRYVCSGTGPCAYPNYAEFIRAETDFFASAPIPRRAPPG